MTSEEGIDCWEDEPVPVSATERGRILFSRDEELLAMAKRFQVEGVHLAGLVDTYQMQDSVGRFVKEAQLLAKTCSVEERAEHVEFLPI